jgi:trypsin
MDKTKNLLVICCLFVLGTSVHCLDTKIVGGFQIRIENAPYQISLQLYHLHICGGSIIVENWILTASHCTAGRQPADLSIRAGSTAFKTGGEVIAVKNIIQHPNYTSHYDYDYSLLELATPLTLDGVTKKAIALPAQDEPILPYTLAKVSGWGATQVSQKTIEIGFQIFNVFFYFSECQRIQRPLAIGLRSNCESRDLLQSVHPI